VVGTAVRGLIDTVADGRTGRLVPPRRPDAVAEAVAALLSDRRALRRMSLAAAQRARTEYPWARVAAATESVYRSVAARDRAWAKSS
jgi:glycosyltransferase involved in cell wall biosynthesis